MYENHTTIGQVLSTLNVHITSLDDATIVFDMPDGDARPLTGPLAYLFITAVRNIEDSEDSLFRAIGGLQRDLSNVVGSLRTGMRVSELGVVQRQGTEIDRLMGVRQAHIDAIIAMAFQLRQVA